MILHNCVVGKQNYKPNSFLCCGIHLSTVIVGSQSNNSLALLLSAKVFLGSSTGSRFVVSPPIKRQYDSSGDVVVTETQTINRVDGDVVSIGTVTT